MNLEENLIIITEQKYKRKLINENILKYNLKIYTKDEFTKLYYHDYKSDVLLYMYNKFNMIPEIAKIILDNLYKIDKNPLNIVGKYDIISCTNYSFRSSLNG